MDYKEIIEWIAMNSNQANKLKGEEVVPVIGLVGIIAKVCKVDPGKCARIFNEYMDKRYGRTHESGPFEYKNYETE
jgi:hypothetical protein